MYQILLTISGFVIGAVIDKKLLLQKAGQKRISESLKTDKGNNHAKNDLPPTGDKRSKRADSGPDSAATDPKPETVKESENVSE